MFFCIWIHNNPVFIFSYLMKNDINKYLKIQNTNSIYYLFGILFLMVVMPFVGAFLAS